MKKTQYFHQFIALIVLTLTLSSCAWMSGRETAGQYMDDATLTGTIKSAMIQHPDLKARQVHVETFQGVVQLSGFIDSAVEKAKVEALVLGTKGVVSVKNDLVVR